jgi:hypothetical protein
VEEEEAWCCLYLVGDVSPFGYDVTDEAYRMDFGFWIWAVVQDDQLPCTLAKRSEVHLLGMYDTRH